MESAEIARVAAGLTRAQRDAVAQARETFIFDRMKLYGRSPALRVKGISVKAWRGGDLLTELGLAVRDHILREKSGG